MPVLKIIVTEKELEFVKEKASSLNYSLSDYIREKLEINRNDPCSVKSALERAKRYEIGKPFCISDLFSDDEWKTVIASNRAGAIGKQFLKNIKNSEKIVFLESKVVSIKGIKRIVSYYVRTK